MLRLAAILIAVGLTLSAAPAHATDYLPEGYLAFCRHHAALCGPQGGPMATRAQVAAVNRSVNQRIAYADDRPVVVGWTVPPAGVKRTPLLVTDTWTVGPVRGDCEDYAVTKLGALLKQGVGRDHLRLALTKVRGVGHIVLLAETAGGWLVLDNRTDAVTAPGRLLATEVPGRAWTAQ